MAKSSKKRTAAPTRSLRKQAKPKILTKKPTTHRPVRGDTKQSTAIGLLRSPGGTTLEALVKATGWKQHSVRGFLAGVVRKRLKLELTSTLSDGQRTYRVIGTDTQVTSKVPASGKKL